MKNILLIGSNGQIGWELQLALAPLGNVFAVSKSLCDLAKPSTIIECINSCRPDLIVNAGAYTAVDKAEEELSLARAINGVAPGILAEEAKKREIAFIHYSTDYVFDGTSATPYTEKDQPNPINAYGVTKLMGEEAIQAAGGNFLILRTSWIYSARGPNFFLTMRKLLSEKKEVRVVNDQIGTPNWSRSVAEITALVAPKMEKERAGIYHVSGEGSTSWYGFSRVILTMLPIEVPARLVPITTAEYPTLAKRPAFSVLNTQKLHQNFGLSLPPWNIALASFLNGFLS